MTARMQGGITQLCLRLQTWDSTREIATWSFYVTQYSQFFSFFNSTKLTFSKLLKIQSALLQIKNKEPQFIQQNGLVWQQG